MGVCNCSMFCCTLLNVHSSIAIILMGKKDLVALLNLSSWCLVMVERLFLAVPRGCLRFVIVVFPDHTHVLFLIEIHQCQKRPIFFGYGLKPCYVCLGMSRSLCHPCYRSCSYKLDRDTIHANDIAHDLCEVRSVNFVNTLTYFGENLLRGNYEYDTINKSK